SFFISFEMLGSQSAAQQPTQSPSVTSPTQEHSGEMAVKEATTARVDDAATFRVNVRLVLARVVVRDPKGNAVGNLRKEDFQLFDNGNPQVISHFDLEHNSVAHTGIPVAAASSDAADASKPAETLPSPPKRYVAYLFDDLHLSFENIGL